MCCLDDFFSYVIVDIKHFKKIYCLLSYINLVLFIGHSCRLSKQDYTTHNAPT